MFDQEKQKEIRLTKLQAKKRAENFCAYQERSQQEIRDKLYKWGQYPADVENIIVDLIADNFLNEERFTHAYTSGKFKIKHWGKIKIANGLKFKRIPPRLVNEALNTIDPDEYIHTLTQIIEKKARVLREKEPYKRKIKLAQYAISRGFEKDLIFDILNSNDL
ncbi:regulatory protein RecX [Albibacterium bauzanense]|nr:regulatory protein RecX [Albibacterium bauzanense]